MTIKGLKTNVIIIDDPLDEDGPPPSREALLRFYESLPKRMRDEVEKAEPIKCPELVAALLEIKP